jgi:tetratricopeptide (TPR) repeat protein
MKETHTEMKDKTISSTGEKSVSIAGNVSQSTIHTGDIYNFYEQENQTSPLIRNILESKIENLSTELSQKVAANLEDLREKFREGNSGEAFEGIRLLRNSSNWDAFEPELRASILRALSSMTLAMKGDDAVAEARKLADEARQNNETQNDDVLRARIKTFEEGFEEAVEDFAKINTTESYNLRLNCLLNTGKMKEVLEARENPPAGITLNAETYRFYALALLASKNVDEAGTEIKKAQAEKPNWQYIRFTAAIINYYSAVSPTVLPPHLVSYPRPFPFAWTKIDDASQRKLSEAAEEFSRLAKQFKAGSQEERDCNTWHFACVANLLGRQKEAIEIGKSLLEKIPLIYKFYLGFYSGATSSTMKRVSKHWKRRKQATLFQSKICWTNRNLPAAGKLGKRFKGD